MVEVLNSYLKRHEFSKSELGSIDDLNDIDDVLNEVEDFTKREKSSCTAATEETFPEEISVTSSIEISLITLENEEFNLWDKLRAIKEQGAKIENGITNLMQREESFRSNADQIKIVKKERNLRPFHDKPVLAKKGKQYYSSVDSLRKGMTSQLEKQGIMTPSSKLLQDKKKTLQNETVAAEHEKHNLCSSQQRSKLNEEMKHISTRYESSRVSCDLRHSLSQVDRALGSSLRDDASASGSIIELFSLVSRKGQDENYGKLSLADTAYDLKAASIAAMKEHRKAVIAAISLERSIFNDPSRKYFISPPNFRVENKFSQHDSTFDDLSIIDLTQKNSPEDGKLQTSNSVKRVKHIERVPLENTSKKQMKGLNSVRNCQMNPFDAFESMKNPSTEDITYKNDTGETLGEECPILNLQHASPQHLCDNGKCRNNPSHYTNSNIPGSSANRNEAQISKSGQNISRRLEMSPETSNSNATQTEKGIEVVSTFQTIVCLNENCDEQTVISVVSTLSTSTSHTRIGPNALTGPLHTQSRYHHLYSLPNAPKKPRSTFLQERRDRLQASSDDIFDRLYKLSQPMQQQGKELRKRFTRSRNQTTRPRHHNAQTNENKVNPKLRSSLAFRDEKDIGTRLYKQGMLSMRKLEERRTQNMTRKTRQ